MNSQQSTPLQADAAIAPERSDQFYLAEYTALREEIVRRMEWQHQIMGLVLAAGSAVVSFGTPFLMLLSPILFLFLATLWVHYDVRVNQLGEYIYCQIETQFVGPKGAWESSPERQEEPKSLGWLGSLERFSARGLLVGSQIAIVIIAWTQTGWSLEYSLLLVWDLIVVVITLFIVKVLIPDYTRSENNCIKQ